MSSPATAVPGSSRTLRLPFEAHRGGASVVVGFVVTRLLMLALMATAENFVIGDVLYYWRKVEAMWSVGLAATLNEYPTPVAWILTLPYAGTGGHRIGYLVAYVAFMIILDAIFTWLLFRGADRKRDAAVDFWLAFIVLVGPLTYLRFDLIPAVLAGSALLVVRRRPGLTGILTGVGAAVKLWPALLWGVFLARKEGRRPLSWGFWGVGLGLAVLSLVFGGFNRLVSPLTWQSDRGLQIESLWSVPLMVARAVDPSRWTVDISRYQAFEIFGPGVRGFLLASTVATVLGLAVIGVLYVRAFRAVAPSVRAVGLLVCAVIVIMIVTNKTLSPQYLLWLGGPVAALLLLDRSGVDRADVAPDRHSAAVDGLARQLLLLALLTHLVYPLLYDSLLFQHGHVWLVVATVVTVLRNLLLLAFTVAACRASWVSLGPPRRVPEPAEGPSL